MENHHGPNAYSRAQKLSASLNLQSPTSNLQPPISNIFFTVPSPHHTNHTIHNKMPSKRRSSPTARSSYESDNGFVEDALPRSKKAKTSTSSKSTKDAKKTGGGVGGAAAGADGEIFWELSGKRRVGVSEFKGNTMVNIREYYEKDGGMLPGKKVSGVFHLILISPNGLSNSLERC